MLRVAIVCGFTLLVTAGCSGVWGSFNSLFQGLDGEIGTNAEVYGDELDPVEDGCTLTQGYWKNHEEDWPVDSLDIGGVTYSKDELLALYGTPPSGDASLILEHQLATAMLNVAAGASTPGTLIADGNAWMSANADADGRLPYGTADGAAAAAAVAISGDLDGYNNGASGPGHCDDGPPGEGEGEDCDGEVCGEEGEGEPECDGEICEPTGEGEEEEPEGCFLEGTEIPCSG